MELLTENANLRKKIALQENCGADDDTSNNDVNSAGCQHKKELTSAEAKISDLCKALQDRGDFQLELVVEEKVKLQELNSSLAEKIRSQSEELVKTQAQLQDARDQADLLEFRVLELEEENEKVRAKLFFEQAERGRRPSECNGLRPRSACSIPRLKGEHL